MPLLVNLHHLAQRPVTLKGELPVGDLDIDTRDEMIRLEKPLSHDLEVEQLGAQLLVRGQLDIALNCQCVRCLKPFQHRLRLTDWVCHVPLSGEESAPVSGDCVDLTPYVREDILLAIPQHPLCDPECRGLTPADSGRTGKARGPGRKARPASAWAELDKLKF